MPNKIAETVNPEQVTILADNVINAYYAYYVAYYATFLVFGKSLKFSCGEACQKYVKLMRFLLHCSIIYVTLSLFICPTLVF